MTSKIYKKYNYFINKLFSKNNLFNFKNLAFWNKFFVLTFSAIIWLSLLSILGSSILEKIVNPIKFASNSNVIVEIYPENTKEKSEQKYKVVEKYLQEQSYVSSFNRVSQQEIIDIVHGFSSSFKNQVIMENLPIIVNVKLISNNSDLVETLRLNLSQKVKNIYLDTEKDLIQRLIGPINTIKYFTALIPVIAISIVIAMIFLIIYAILFSHKNTIETLIFLGVYKKTLVFEFARWVFIKTIVSAILATIFIVITTIVLLGVFQLDLSEFPFVIYFSFILFYIFILPLLAMLLGAVFVNRIITKSFNKNLM